MNEAEVVDEFDRDAMVSTWGYAPSMGQARALEDNLLMDPQTQPAALPGGFASRIRVAVLDSPCFPAVVVESL